MTGSCGRLILHLQILTKIDGILKIFKIKAAVYCILQENHIHWVYETMKEGAGMAKQPKKLIANNKKVYHDYFLEETFEAGIALAGTEVKSMRMGKCSIKESFIHIENGEVILYGMHISPYEKGNIFNKDPLRPRKLLMHKKEIQKMVGKIAQKGYTIVPVEVYFKGSLVKVQVALAKGKKLYDKRQDIARKDQRREAERDFKIRNLG